MTRKLTVTLLAAASLALGLSACATDAAVVNDNISQDADNFKVPRRITFFNGITDKYLLTVEGYCSLDAADPKKLTVTCQTGPGQYIRQYLGLSDNVSWFAEQLDPAKVSPDYYHTTFKPETIIPDVELR